MVSSVVIWTNLGVNGRQVYNMIELAEERNSIHSTKRNEY